VQKSNRTADSGRQTARWNAVSGLWSVVSLRENGEGRMEYGCLGCRPEKSLQFTKPVVPKCHFERPEGAKNLTPLNKEVCRDFAGKVRFLKK
ncbi:MAG: hypothetical protein R6V04_07715, partial [bacterium]